VSPRSPIAARFHFGQDVLEEKRVLWFGFNEQDLYAHGR